MKREIVVEVICFLFIVLFVYAAISKWLEIEKFRAQVGQSPLLAPITSLIVWSIPAIELIVAVFLVFPLTRLFGLYASFSIMAMFTSYIVAITHFSVYIPCSCGGILGDLGWTEHLILNLVFVCLAIVAIVTIGTEQLKA